eukprot:TRINITY_DN2084_c0_g4_i1.p1 TRINITY_DN2084_c0_g4~~TRINITY_DN2084_c0_g4_i1.p1  ORF type:complete len:608 (+),score=53.78 TRINITY_DN2084_c0_g4_i1:112-1935(+)
MDDRWEREQKDLCLREISCSTNNTRRYGASFCSVHLPYELLWGVFSFLDPASLCSSGSVSVCWYNVANDPTLWRAVYQRDFQVSWVVTKEGHKDWKKYYFRVARKFALISAKIFVNPQELGNYVIRAQLHTEASHFKAAYDDWTCAIERKKARPFESEDTTLGLLLLRRALVLRLLHKAEQSIQDISLAIQLEPDSAHFYRIRGNWRRETGDLEGALSDYSYAVTLQPSVAVHYFCRGIAYKDQKNFVLAIKDMDLAIQLDPDNANYRCSRGRMYSHLGFYEEAMKDLNHAVQIDPTNSDYLHWRGRVLRDSQEYEKALKDFEQALSLTHDDIDYAWCSIMYSQMKNNAKARYYIQKAISIAPANSFHHQFKGILNFGLGNHKNGLSDFNTAINLLPTWSGHYVWRAAIYSELRETERAMADLDTAVRLRADEIALFWRGLLHLGLGNLTKSKYDLKAALVAAEAPVHSRILFWLGVSLFIDGEKHEARKLWEKTLQNARNEKRVAHHTEPARVALVVNQDENNAKNHYCQFFKAYYTIDNTKTENSHLELLSSLFPHNQAIATVTQWFKAEREKLCCIMQAYQIKKMDSSCGSGDTEKKHYEGVAG